MVAITPRTARSGSSENVSVGGRRVHRTRLAKAALGGKVDGKLIDASSHQPRREVGIVTDKDPEGLGSSAIRQRTARLRGEGLFPDAQVTSGP
jgi:threonyl-tRNA synthetase